VIRGAEGSPEILLQTELVHFGDKNNRGVLVTLAAIPWLEIAQRLGRDPNFLFQFSQYPRKFEEFIAACYVKAGFDEVTLTPQRNDRGVDVIAVKKGVGSIRYLDQVKAYKPGHRVSHNDVRAMLGSLSLDPDASRGLVTTTSTFEPGILKMDGEFSSVLNNTLELKDGAATLKWIEDLRKQQA
tara:strand:- start:5031 stop:5582 length:552 start_codon:yes stop_codon:yes gene_type:complete